MDAVSRRGFLQQALVAGAGTRLTAPLLGAGAAAALRDSVSTPQPPAELDPNFIAGRVVERVADDEYLVEDPDKKIRPMRVSPPTRVWKRAYVNRYGVVEGDCLYARGQLQPDGVLAVDRLWVDIITFPATVMQATADVHVMSEWTGDEFKFPVAPFTEVEQAGGGYAKGDASTLQRDDGLQAVGFGIPEDGTFSPSRLILRSARARPQDARGAAVPFVRSNAALAPGPDGELQTCQYTYYGITTWFCCGGVLACGATCTGQCADNNCGEYGGFCTGCRTDSLHMAWPNVCRQSGTDCRGTICASCCTSFPQLTCQDSIRCENPCNNNVTTCTIKDHGPQTRCTPPATCKNRDTIKFDLTACAFSALGSLDWGKQALNATVYLPC